MSVLAWVMIILATLNIFFTLRSAASGGPNPNPIQGWVVVGHIIGLVAQVALGGRVVNVHHEHSKD